MSKNPKNRENVLAYIGLVPLPENVILSILKTETLKAYQGMAFEMTMIKGLTESSIGKLATLSETMEKRFNAVDTRFTTLEAELLEHKTLLTQILARLPEKP